MIIDIQSQFFKRENVNTLTLNISYINDKGKVSILNRKIDNPQVWETTKNLKQASENYKNWNGEYVKRVTLANNPNKFQILDLMHEHLTVEEIELLKGMDEPWIQSIDIETEVIDSFPDPETVKERITTIAIATMDKKVLVIGWKELSFPDLQAAKKIVKDYMADYGDYELIYKKFDDEVSMMKFFIEMLMPKMSLIIGWNFFDYDWKYIYNRCNKLGIDVKKASPFNKLTGKENTPLHIGMLDYLPVYKKHDRTVKVKESNRLDWVAETVLGKKKLAYDGTIKNLFENNFLKYVAYNAIDAILVLCIHEKLKTIDTPLMLANRNLVPLSKSSSPVQLTENMLYFGYKKVNCVTVDNRKGKSATDESYEGAYVKEPICGMYKDVCCFDFASLYPSLIRLLNISPESYIGKFSDGELEFYKDNLDYIISITGAVFSKKEISVLKKLIDDLYAERRFYKDRYLTLKKFLNDNGVDWNK